jgi:amino acid adenylation domain-containing protein
MDGDSLTYEQLESRACQLACYLRRLGVGPGVLVAVYHPRSLDLLVTLLGILKAGGSYLPLDPCFPLDRLTFMVSDSKAAVLVTEDDLAEGLVSRLGEPQPRVVRLDTDCEAIQSSTNDQEVRAVGDVTPDDLAYVIYTSGSTGRPKGVQVHHRAVVNFLTSMGRQPGLETEDILLSVTTLSFDISVLEVFLPLIKGAKLVLASQETARDGCALAQLIADCGATVMQATPATWRLLLDAGWTGATHLKVLCGGEALPKDLARQLLERVNSLWNMYGPTETTVWSTIRRITAPERAVSIGRPIANTQVYILDDNLQIVPRGAVGQLYIGGDGVSRGYLNRPELTAERFVCSPFDERSEERIYATGDLARFLPDGSIEFLGRADNQVKIHGFRIELGEIEAALEEQPSIGKCAVKAWETEHISGDKQLVAYVVFAPGPQPTAAELRSTLKESLPDHMIPSMFHIMDSLPTTPNGKIDRKSLPPPASANRARHGSFTPPQDGLQRQLTGIWEKVLGTKRVGIDDDFFDLGGHSLLAPRLFQSIERITGENLPFATLFQAPTVRQMAGVLLDRGWSPPWSCLVPIQPAGSRVPFFCVHGHGGNVVGFHDLARHLGADQPFFGLQAQGLDGKLECPLSVEEMAAHYVWEIRAAQPEGPYCLGGYCVGGTIALEMARQLRAEGDDVELVALIHAETPDYARQMLRNSWWRRFVTSVQYRIHLELSNLLEVEPKRRWSHIRQRVERSTQRLRVAGERILQPMLKSLGVGLPRSQAHDFALLEQAHVKAHLEYDAKPYDGPVLLLHAVRECPADSPDRSLGWSALLNGDVKYEDVPGHRVGMLSEPRVRIVAHHLGLSLDATRTEHVHRAHVAESDEDVMAAASD